MSATLLLGSCEPRLRELSDCSIDALVTDPPAGIGFMNREWDSDKGGRDQWIAWLAGVMRECLRVLRPGGYALVWALPRTSHWTATAIEDAGFEIRDVHHDIVSRHDEAREFIRSLDVEQRRLFDRLLNAAGEASILYALFGTGFPKSLNIAKNGATRWDGYGTALKPAVEHWILARRPLEGTYAENVIKHGTGALRIDECRIGGRERADYGLANARRTQGATYGAPSTSADFDATLGRWPAHLSLSHADGCRPVGERVEERATFERTEGREPCGVYNHGRGRTDSSRQSGTVSVKHEVWQCVEGCPVRTLDEQSLARGMHSAGSRKAAGDPRGSADAVTWQHGGGSARHGDTGGASRFFYIAKPSRREKDAGLEDLPAVSGGEATGHADGGAGTKSPRAGAGRTGDRRNQHPCVKAVALMRWLVRLITPPGGLVLDCFAGSGTTGVACAEEGLRFIGIEQDEKHHETARLRLKRAFGAVAVEMSAQRDLAAVLTAQPRVS